MFTEAWMKTKSRDSLQRNFQTQKQTWHSFTSMESVRSRVSAKIVGISWRKIHEVDENDYPDSPRNKPKSRRSTGTPLRDRNRQETEEKVGTVLLKRARSVRDAFGSFRQVCCNQHLWKHVYLPLIISLNIQICVLRCCQHNYTKLGFYIEDFRS